VKLPRIPFQPRAGALAALLALQAGDAIKRIAGIRRIDNRLVSGDQIGWD